MPLYDYVCEACRHRFEVIHGVHGEGPATCPSCGKGPIRKGITTAAIHYKGSGWAKKERHAAVKSGVKADSDGSGGETGAGGKDGDKATNDADKGGDKAVKPSSGTEKGAPSRSEKAGRDRTEKAGEDRSAKPSAASTGD